MGMNSPVLAELLPVCFCESGSGIICLKKGVYNCGRQERLPGVVLFEDFSVELPLNYSFEYGLDDALKFSEIIGVVITYLCFLSKIISIVNS